MTFVQSLIDAVALGTLFALVAMGVGLIFGVTRLVNFAYGELITAGAYALLLTKGLAVVARIVVAIAAVVVLSLVMEVVYRPLRTVGPATMLVATFAVSFLLQNAALLVFGSQGENIGFLTDLNQALEIGSLRIRWITLVGLGVGGVLLTLMGVVLGRTDIGLQMRAAAADFGTARLLGVRAQRVIRVAFVLGGILAAAVGLVLAVQRPLVTPGYGFAVLVPALVGVVVGGLDRLVPATLGGFAVGFATVLLGNVLPPGGRVFLDTALFTLVIIVLLAKPNGLFAGSRQVGERI